MTAASDWQPAFLKSKESLPFRTSQLNRLSRVTSFNRSNVVIFFTNFASVHDRFKFWGQDIYSVNDWGDKGSESKEYNCQKRYKTDWISDICREKHCGNHGSCCWC
ncbi:hypothetical protein AVEN_178244-1 [Araneus ventricosus]|uniref:Uncharacterized protein n=1 Tax=Araneus ventricosus TaxID=182803 RepID=A0A4Y2WR83_ARAVE|nr:hypothetical protein AVEN_8862-1 [Araneus ventricosus]GBO39635.1 hypothetical protein AVEN_178244-1 [Araneus ventricosus]